MVIYEKYQSFVLLTVFLCQKLSTFLFMGGKIEPFLGQKNQKIMIFTSFLGEKSISLGGPNYP